MSGIEIKNQTEVFGGGGALVGSVAMIGLKKRAAHVEGESSRYAREMRAGTNGNYSELFEGSGLFRERGTIIVSDADGLGPYIAERVKEAAKYESKAARAKFRAGFFKVAAPLTALAGVILIVKGLEFDFPAPPPGSGPTGVTGGTRGTTGTTGTTGNTGPEGYTDPYSLNQ